MFSRLQQLALATLAALLTASGVAAVTAQPAVVAAATSNGSR
jgi:hypothetical protein